MFYENRNIAFRLLGVYRVMGLPVSLSERGRRGTALSLRIKGSSTFSLGDRTLPASSGYVSYLPAGVDYDRETREEEELIILRLAAIGEEGETVETVGNCAALRPLFEALLSEWEGDAADRYSRSMVLLYRILEGVARAARPSQREIPALIAPGVSALASRFRDPTLTVASLAAMCHISEAYFRRLYRATFGTSPVRSLLDRRFEYARELLASGYYQTKEVAAMAGFSDVKYFRVAFRSRYGVTPTAYAAMA